jgi:hypothetical protein
LVFNIERPEKFADFLIKNSAMEYPPVTVESAMQPITTAPNRRSHEVLHTKFYSETPKAN